MNPIYIPVSLILSLLTFISSFTLNPSLTFSIFSIIIIIPGTLLSYLSPCAPLIPHLHPLLHYLTFTSCLAYRPPSNHHHSTSSLTACLSYHLTSSSSPITRSFHYPFFSLPHSFYLPSPSPFHYLSHPLPYPSSPNRLSLYPFHTPSIFPCSPIGLFHYPYPITLALHTSESALLPSTEPWAVLRCP